MRIVSVTLVCWMICVGAWAQAVSTGQITGVVRDSSGLAVPGAEVKVTQTATGLVRTAITEAAGEYVLPNLPVGPYQLEVTKEGFAKYVQTGIVLQVASNPTVEVTLRVGAVSEQVQVEANATMVETQATGVGSVIENQRILEMPLNGRNAADLVFFAGPVVQAGLSSSRSWQGQAGGEGFSVAGGTTWGTTFMLDGAMHNDPYDNFNLPLPFPDALQEFKVETSALTAQNGVHSGASVNAVIKSGTNEFHGDVFEFIRNGALNARNFFAPTRDTLKRNQYGGTVGGPILKNKLFFFGAYQGTRTRSDPATQFAFVPTQDMLNGDFSALASAACQGQQVNLTDKVPQSRKPIQFINNRILPSDIDPVAVNIAKKLPTADNPCGRVPYGTISAPNEYQLVGRTDYQKSAKHTIFGRYMATAYTQPVPYTLNPNNVLVTTIGGRDNLAQSVTLGDTYLVGSNMVNSFRAAFNRTAIQRSSVNDFGPEDVGVQGVYNYTPHQMLLTVTGAFTVGSGTESNSNFRGSTYQLGDDVSWIRGSHQFAFGGESAMWNSASYANVRSPGAYTFNGNATGLALVDFLTGKLQQLDQAAPNTLFTRQWYLGAFAQDTWRISQRLTLNYGVRWEPWFPTIVTNAAIYNYDLNRFINGVKSTVYKNAPAGMYWPGDPGFPGNKGIFNRLSNFGPRVGLAWDPKGDGRMTIRASYGLGYDFANGQFYINATIAPPFGDETRTSFGPGGLDNPWQGIPGGNPFPLSFDRNNALFVPFGPYLSTNPHQKNTAVHQWNFTVQKQIGTPWLATASYIGNETSHLVVTIPENPAVYIPGSTLNNLNARRLANLIRPSDGQLLGFVDGYDDGATMHYHALSLSLQRRLARNVSAQANYIWSHCITPDRYGHGGGTVNVANTILDPSNMNYDKGDCTWDRRHIFNLSVVAQTPKFATAMIRHLASGWQAALAVRYQSAIRLTVTDTADTSLNAVANQRPNLVMADPYAPNKGGPCPSKAPCVSWLNVKAFALPVEGTLGNMSPGEITGPSFSDISMSLSRTFQLRERLRMDIRGDAFNLPNSMRPGGTNPSQGNFIQPVNVTSAAGAGTTGAYGTSIFGTITNAFDPRILQFSLKFIF
jgi:hypothetical protein